VADVVVEVVVEGLDLVLAARDLVRPDPELEEVAGEVADEEDGAPTRRAFLMTSSWKSVSERGVASVLSSTAARASTSRAIQITRSERF
jgi:hypothetical protein